MPSVASEINAAQQSRFLHSQARGRTDGNDRSQSSPFADMLDSTAQAADPAPAPRDAQADKSDDSRPADQNRQADNASDANTSNDSANANRTKDGVNAKDGKDAKAGDADGKDGKTGKAGDAKSADAGDDKTAAANADTTAKTDADLAATERAVLEGLDALDVARVRGEEHMWTPDAVAKLQHAVRGGQFSTYQEYARIINDQSKRHMTLRGLFDQLRGTFGKGDNDV